MITRRLKGEVPESVLRTLEDMDQRITQMLSDLASLKASSRNGNGALSPAALKQVAGLIGARSQSVIGVDVSDPSLPGQLAGGTVTSFTIVGDPSNGLTVINGGPITTSGTINVTFGSSINVATSFKVATVKVVGAQGAAVADVASPDAVDLASAITLANETKAQLNAWLSRARAATGHGLIG